MKKLHLLSMRIHTVENTEDLKKMENIALFAITRNINLPQLHLCPSQKGVSFLVPPESKIGW